MESISKTFELVRFVQRPSDFIPRVLDARVSRILQLLLVHLGAVEEACDDVYR